MKNDDVLKPLFFLARIISSKRRIDGQLGRVVSRSWMNSLNAFKVRTQDCFRKGHEMIDNIPCVSFSIAVYSDCSLGRLRMNPSISKW